MEPDRRFLVELEDLMGRFHRTAWSISDQTDGKMEMPLEPMLNALEQQVSRLRRQLDRSYFGKMSDWLGEDGEPPSKPDKAERHMGDALWMPPLTEEQRRQWQSATPMEQEQFCVERFCFGTFFTGADELSYRGRRPNPEVEFKSKLIAAYSQFREWEGEPAKAAIEDAVTRYKTSRTSVIEARQKWCPQMQHLRPHFDREAAKKFRERLDKSSRWSPASHPVG